jgi:Yip1-like protein
MPALNRMAVWHAACCLALAECIERDLEGMSMLVLLRRAIRAALLDPGVYEEVEADTRSMGQATLIVLLASLAGGLGAGWPSARNIILAAFLTLSGWIVWAALTFWIGTHLLPESQTRADLGQLLRTIGFANSPGVLRVVGIFPPLRSIVFAITTIWVLVTTIVAVRQALDYRGTLRAVGVCGIGWLVQVGFLIFTFAFLAVTSGPAY